MATSTTTSPPSLLPTAKVKTGLRPETAKVLVYGPPKIGKSTLAAKFNPDHTLFLAFEPGLGGLEVFQTPIGDWDTFLKVCAELAKGGHDFQTIVLDTVDMAAKMCQDYAMKQLGVAHPSDAAYGKGWDAVTNEFRLKIAKLASLGYGMWFISHSVDKDVEQRVGKITKTVPTLGGRIRDFVIGFVDVIVLAESELGEHGEQRVLRTRPTERYEAGARDTELEDPLPLDAQLFKAAMKDAWS